MIALVASGVATLAVVGVVGAAPSLNLTQGAIPRLGFLTAAIAAVVAVVFLCYARLQARGDYSFYRGRSRAGE